MRFSGQVKWFDPSRGFGLITRTRGEPDCIVRHAGMQGTLLLLLVRGENVEFDVIQGVEGPEARNVVRVGLSAPACRRTWAGE